MSKKLIYVHDPMCSWCFGFSKVYQQITEQLPEDIELIRLLGGLAPDTDEFMPESTRQMVQQNWRRIEQRIPGVEFNYDFWTKCQPRRATYPACRAVIAAREQGDENDVMMTQQIQQAYYRQARNPSENETLIELAGELGLDQDRFSEQLVAGETHQQLLDEIATAIGIGISGFPSLILQENDRLKSISINYVNVDVVLEQISG
ncbi:MAG: DsbA family protein [Nitrosomonas sp.]|nr:DsbA family protein [Nitrosomonas sp.]